MTLKNDDDLAKIPERQSHVIHGPIDQVSVDKVSGEKDPTQLDNQTATPKDDSKNDFDAEVAKNMNQEVLQKMDNTFNKVNTVLQNPNLDEDVKKNIFSKISDVIGHRINSGEITKDQAIEKLNLIDAFKQMGQDKLNTFVDLSLDSSKNQQTVAK
jgi:hypothetical protein